MLDAPRQDWSYYASRTAVADAERLSGMSHADRFAWYADAHNLLWKLWQQAPNRERLEADRWQRKLAARMRVVELLTPLEGRSHGSSPATGAG